MAQRAVRRIPWFLLVLALISQVTTVAAFADDQVGTGCVGLVISTLLWFVFWCELAERRTRR